jgi:hypothetical protein
MANRTCCQKSRYPSTRCKGLEQLHRDCNDAGVAEVAFVNVLAITLGHPFIGGANR